MRSGWVVDQYMERMWQLADAHCHEHTHKGLHFFLCYVMPWPLSRCGRSCPTLSSIPVHLSDQESPHLFSEKSFETGAGRLSARRYCRTRCRPTEWIFSKYIHLLLPRPLQHCSFAIIETIICTCPPTTTSRCVPSRPSSSTSPSSSTTPTNIPSTTSTNTSPDTPSSTTPTNIPSTTSTNTPTRGRSGTGGEGGAGGMGRGVSGGGARAVRGSGTGDVGGGIGGSGTGDVDA